jgi:hypothetical protein
LKYLNRKLNELEKNVLPNHPDPAKIYIENEAERELCRKANRIRQNISVDVMEIWRDNKLTFDQKQEETIKIYNQLDEREKQILSKETEFLKRRLEDVLISYFEATFPYKSREPLLRVTWFFNEMDKLALAKFIEDSEWCHNRNEDDPEFDDFEWWHKFDLKLMETFPNGIFTEKSYNKAEQLYDEILSKLMREYWQAHPKEFESLSKKVENEKKKER